MGFRGWRSRASGGPSGGMGRHRGVVVGDKRGDLGTAEGSDFGHVIVDLLGGSSKLTEGIGLSG